ncbi:MAG: NUDIX hydrolase [Stackebrandtia sp.]
MIKHATASAFLFHRDPAAGWRTGLILHPRMGVWMMPGGHVEDDENSAEAVLREVREETGLARVRLLTPHAPDGSAIVFADSRPVDLPYWIVEHLIADGDNQLAQAHVHVDHKYLAVADDDAQVAAPAHPFQWRGRDALAELPMLDDVRRGAEALFDVLTRAVPAGESR